MNCHDIACILAAAAGLDEADSPDVLNIVPKPSEPRHAILEAILQKNRERLARIAKQRRRPMPRRSEAL